MPGDNDLDVLIPAGTIPQSLWDLLEACAVNTTATLPGQAHPMSSTKILETIQTDPLQYQDLKQVGSVAAAGGAGYLVAGLFTPAAPLVAFALALTAIFSADERMVTLIVLNGLDQALVRETDSNTSLVHGMQTGHPSLVVVDPVTQLTLFGAENTIPARSTRMAIKPGHPPAMETVYGMGMYRFQKTQVNLFGKIPIPFALFGVEGGMTLKTADGARTGIGIGFMVPETGANAFAVALDVKPHYGDIAGFVAATVSKTSTITHEVGQDVQIWASMTDRNFPDSAGTTDVVLTVAILPV